MIGKIPPYLEAFFQFGVERLFRLDQRDFIEKHTVVDPPVDCILINPSSIQISLLDALIDRSISSLDEHAQLGIVYHDIHGSPFENSPLDELLKKQCLMRYQEGVITDPSAQITSWAITAVRSSYNPVLHARKIAGQGRPDCAIEILNNIPMDLISDENMLARLALEKQQYYFRWQQIRDGYDPPHAFFSKARREFAQVTALSPLLTESYHLHANYWVSMGREDMANRVLRSLCYVQPVRPKKNDPDHPKALGKTKRPDLIEQAPIWKTSYPQPRILIITHDYSDYGMDTLFHGLCAILGNDNVVEYPWKPMLHGQNRKEAANYPCVFDYPGKPVAVQSLIEQLKQGHFDFILYADVVQMAHRDEVRSLINADPAIPVVLYDTWDDSYTPLGRILSYIGRKCFDLMFKREMLNGVDYGPDTYPLPFGYPDISLTTMGNTQKTRDVFWAGKNEYGLRPIYIPALEKRLGRSLNQRYTQAEYKLQLQSSLIGLSFFGCGFDTVRYWELPANKVMLLAERPPIRIPHNFIDDESVVFFDDLPEMMDKLDYYLRQPEKAEQIALTGFQFYQQYHTTSARARQFLGRVAQYIRIAANKKNKNGKLDEVASNYQPSVSIIHAKAGIQYSHSVMNHHRHEKDDRQPYEGEKPKSPDTQPKLYLGLVKGDGYGWGVCSRYLIQEISKMQTVAVLNDEDGTAANAQLNGKLFQALTNVDFDPMFEKARGSQNFGYTFFENELTAKSLENAKKYDLVFGGSTWCRDRMLEKGITNCGILIQGIDPAVFHPIGEEKSRERFVIFSGGKFELRKGQDLVLKAVKILQDKYPDIWLLNCWYNLWPASTRLMSYSRHIRFRHCEGETWQQTMLRTYAENGLDSRRIITNDLIPQEFQRALFAQTDIGVFPNRCEGGTNLVLMEYMACGKPVIAANNSGHRDVVSSGNALLLNTQTAFNVTGNDGKLIARWYESSLDELVAHMEYAYHHRDAVKHLGKQAGEDLRVFTWKSSAQQLIHAINTHK